MCSVYCRRPYASRQPVLAAVGLLDGVCLVVESRDSQNRTEDLIALSPNTFRMCLKDCRLDKPPPGRLSGSPATR